MAQKHPEQYFRLQGLVEQLTKEAEPIMAAYGELQDRALAGGVLSRHIKALLALGIAVAQCSDNDVAIYVHDALKAGASRQEILETIGVAIVMGGKPAVVTGAVALEAVEQL